MLERIGSVRNRKKEYSRRTILGLQCYNKNIDRKESQVHVVVRINSPCIKGPTY